MKTLTRLVSAAALAVAMFGIAAQATHADDGAAKPEKKDFLYFKDPEPASNPALAAENDLSSVPLSIGVVQPRQFLSLEQLSGLRGPVSGVFTPRAARTHIGFVVTGAGVSLDQGDDRKGLHLGFSSELPAQPLEFENLLASPELAAPFDRRAQQFGVNVGYGGFALDARYSELSDGFADPARGLDLGLSYKAKSWRTSLSVSEVVPASRSRGFIDFRDGYERYYAVELGAAYHLMPGLALSGGIRYADYGDRYRFNFDDGTTDSRIFMGTAVTF